MSYLSNALWAFLGGVAGACIIYAWKNEKRS